MATRKRLYHPDEVKQKIQASQLINRLTKHALSDEPILDASQVNAIKILVGKVLPDVKAVEYSMPPESPGDKWSEMPPEKRIRLLQLTVREAQESLEREEERLQRMECVKENATD